MNKEVFAILIINSYINKEQRVLKTIDALKAVQITPVVFSYSDSFEGCICLPYPQPDSRKSHLHYNVILRKSISAALRLKTIAGESIHSRFFRGDKQLAKKILNTLQPFQGKCIAVIAHHLQNLAIAGEIASHLKIDLIFNAHEYYPEQFIENKLWRKSQKRLIAIASRYLKRCYRIFTVCKGIQKRYETEFRLRPDQQVLVINAVKFKKLNPSAIGSKIKLIHHGIANRNRRLELMIEVADHVDKNRFEFHFILISSSYDLEYFNYLKTEIEKRKNCFLANAAPTEEIPDYINQFDLGFYMYDNSSNFNMMHYLPNKLFEFIQARCGVVIGPYVEMMPVVKEYKIGVAVEENTVQAMAAAINKITVDDVKAFKRNTATAALELCGENEIKKMQKVFEGILKKEYDKV